MPRPYQRTRSRKRTILHTPSGSPTTHYNRERRNLPHCAECGAILAGMASYAGANPRSSKRISRKFGGRLCHNCTALRIREAARGVAG